MSVPLLIVTSLPRNARVSTVDFDTDTLPPTAIRPTLKLSASERCLLLPVAVIDTASLTTSVLLSAMLL